ncbi:MULTISPECIES: hypothetical protein [Aequorivita]|uniref:Uncharacterized protein n=1 Tax=Aequorivita iocasae TaxID=2803865 RepID=A0ABX7DT13_9FLAO|nr:MULTISPECIES: hypothetical protein [Aequorivita]QQX76960.1 hypothetical protein JK629_01415 [Aequorivita iocasae]UCA56439.1 hypothetical protein LDL78_01430 [Aequorivita sp. F7]
MTKRLLLLLLGPQETQSTIIKNIQQRFSTDFIAANFDVSEYRAVDSLFYAQEIKREKDLLNPENEMQLIEFLFIKSKEYKERGE